MHNKPYWKRFQAPKKTKQTKEESLVQELIEKHLGINLEFVGNDKLNFNIFPRLMNHSNHVYKQNYTPDFVFKYKDITYWIEVKGKFPFNPFKDKYLNILANLYCKENNNIKFISIEVWKDKNHLEYFDITNYHNFFNCLKKAGETETEFDLRYEQIKTKRLQAGKIKEFNANEYFH